MSGAMICFLLCAFTCSDLFWVDCAKCEPAEKREAFRAKDASDVLAALDTDSPRGHHIEHPPSESAIEVEDFSAATQSSAVPHRVSTRRQAWVVILVVATVLMVSLVCVTIMVCCSFVKCSSSMRNQEVRDRLPTNRGNLDPGTFWDTLTFDEIDEREAETRAGVIANLVSQMSGEFDHLSRDVVDDGGNSEIAAYAVFSTKPAYVAIVPSTEVEEHDDAGMMTRHTSALESWFGAKLTWWESQTAFSGRARPEGSVALLDVKKVHAWTEQDDASTEQNSIQVTSAEPGVALVLKFKNNLEAQSWASAFIEALNVVKKEETIRKLVAQARERSTVSRQEP